MKIYFTNPRTNTLLLKTLYASNFLLLIIYHYSGVRNGQSYKSKFSLFYILLNISIKESSSSLFYNGLYTFKPTAPLIRFDKYIVSNLNDVNANPLDYRNA